MESLARPANGTEQTKGSGKASRREKYGGFLRPSVTIFALLFLFLLLGSFSRTYEYLTHLVIESATFVDSVLSEDSGEDSDQKQNHSIKEHPPPPATRPVTLRGGCGEIKDYCVNTLFTEYACNSSIFPFSSTEEKEMFSSWFDSRSPVEKIPDRARCEMLQQQTPDQIHGRNGTVPWCQENSDSFNVTTIPIGCSKFSHSPRSGAFQGMMVFPQGNLALCGVPKVAVTQWLQFLRFTFGAKDYQALPHYKVDRHDFLFDMYNIEAQTSILNDDAWTKAIFIRDPAERLLSAYLDKVHNAKPDKHWPWRNSNLSVSFPEFVDILSMSNATCPPLHLASQMSHPGSGLNWCSDPHWRPQVYSCGIYETLPNFAFVGSLEDAGPNTKALLESVNMWESYGKHYRTDKFTPGNICDKMPPPPLQPGQVATGFQQKPHNTSRSHGGGDTHGHNKDAKARIDQYYTEELREKVRKLYAMDYALYDVLQNQFGGRAHGKDLARALNPTCSQK